MFNNTIHFLVNKANKFSLCVEMLNGTSLESVKELKKYVSLYKTQHSTL